MTESKRKQLIMSKNSKKFSFRFEKYYITYIDGIYTNNPFLSKIRVGFSKFLRLPLLQNDNSSKCVIWGTG